MKCVALAILGLVFIGSATAGEMVSGTNSYLAELKIWPTGEYAGYYIYDSTGTFKAQSGPISDGPVECHGAGFWTAVEINGNGICIFGENPDRWTVTIELTPNSQFSATTAEKYRSRGIWTIVRSTGIYTGMTGAGTFVNGPVVDGRKTTKWEGEIELRY